METLLWIISLPVGVIALIAMYPPGLALLVHAFVAFRDSKAVQWLTVGLAVLVAVWAMRRDARKQGQKEALRDVQAATERAVESKREIDREVERTPLQRKRDEMGRWSK